MPSTKRREPTEEELDAAAERLDQTDLGDYWHLTRPAHFEMPPRPARSAVVIEPDLWRKVRLRAKKLGKTPEALVEEWLRAGLAAR